MEESATHLEQGSAVGDSSLRGSTDPRRKLSAILLCALFYNAGISVVMFLHSLFLAELGWREQAVGAVNGMVLFGGLLAVLPLAKVAERIGLRATLSVTLLLAAVAFSCRLWATQYGAQNVLSFLGGVGLAGWIVCISPAVADAVAEPERSQAFKQLFAVSLVAGAGGGLLGGWLPQWLRQPRFGGATLVSSERATLFFDCVLLAFSVAPALRLRGKIVQSVDRSAGVLRNAGLQRFLLGTSGWNLALGAFVPFVGFLFARELHVSLPKLSVIFAVLQFTQALGVVTLAKGIERKVGPILTVTALQVGAGLSLLFLAGT